MRLTSNGRIVAAAIAGLLVGSATTAALVRSPFPLADELVYAETRSSIANLTALRLLAREDYTGARRDLESALAMNAMVLDEWSRRLDLSGKANDRAVETISAISTHRASVGGEEQDEFLAAVFARNASTR